MKPDVSMAVSEGSAAGFRTISKAFVGLAESVVARFGAVENGAIATEIAAMFVIGSLAVGTYAVGDVILANIAARLLAVATCVVLSAAGIGFRSEPNLSENAGRMQRMMSQEEIAERQLINAIQIAIGTNIASVAADQAVNLAVFAGRNQLPAV